jgi:hypothetical protein
MTGRIYANNLFPCQFFDSTITESASDLFLTKLDTNGNFIWVKVAAPGSLTLGTQGYKVRIDSNGMIHVAGRGGSNNGIFFPGFNYSPRIFAARFDTSGNMNRMLNLCTDLGQDFNDFKLSLNDDQYIAGYFIADSITIGPQVLYRITLTGGADLYFAKFDSSGLFQWVIHAGDTNFTGLQGTGIDFFQNNDIILAGDISPSVTLGGFTFSNSLSSTPGRPIPFVARFNPQGQVIWADNSENQYVTSTTGGVKVLPNGYAFFSGFFGGNAIFGSSAFNSTGLKDIFLGEVSASGIITSGNKLDGTGSKEEPECMTTDVYGNIFLGGGFDGTLNVNGQNITSAGGNTDGFIAKYGAVCPVGIEEEPGEAEAQLFVFPNPASDKFYVSGKALRTGSRVELINLLGAKVSSAKITSAHQKIAIDISRLPGGLYLLQITDDEKKLSAKVLVE